MNLTKIKLLSWNCRGLGNLEKCLVVRNIIRESRCDFVCLQETKLSSFEFNHAVTLLPSYFQRDCVCLNAVGSSGGCLIAWKNGYSKLSSWATRHTISVSLVQQTTGQVFILTSAYGPTDDNMKRAFMEELRFIHKMVTVPWLLVGDFNLVRFIDWTGDMRSFGLMTQFNDLINDLALLEVPLKNRSFTWSSKRPSPSFSKLDRVFASGEWSDHFPHLTLSALEVIVSDHAPLLLNCKQLQQVRKPLRMEKFWFNFPQVKDRVKEIWTQEGGCNTLLFEKRTIALQKGLKNWHTENFGNLGAQLQKCKDEILVLDKLEESQNLDDAQFKNRQQLREKAYNLATIAEIRWFQRLRCRWIALGDSNTKFFHNFASSRHRQNMVLQLKVQGQYISEPMMIQNSFLNHMRSLLGHQELVQDFDPSALYPSKMNLDSLQEPFGVAKIEAAARSLATNKASGPDGLSNEFVQVYWEEVGSDIVTLLQGFSRGEIDLRAINRADIRMIPKREGAEELKDYRPISIINLIPKLISKLLARRLAQHLPQLVSPYHTAFVRGRQISENFLSTREMMQHISNAK